MIPFPTPLLFGGSGSAGSPLSAHRYWRVHVTATAGGSTCAIVELEMYEAEFGPNVCSGGTPSASSVVTAAVPFTAARAFDGSLADGQSSSANQDLWAGSTSNEWLAYDFGAGNSRAIIGIGMHGRQNAFTSQNPTAFTVEYSDDGTNWFSAWSVSGLSWAAREFKRSINPSYTTTSYTGSPWGTHLYWRLAIQSSQDDSTPPALAEIEMHGTPAGADQCNSGTASASSTYSSSFLASNGFDNNNSTLWSAASGAFDAQWIQYQFASAVSVAELKLTARNDTAVNTSPLAFALRYSDSSSGPWTTAIAANQIAAWTLGLSRTYTDPKYI